MLAPGSLVKALRRHAVGGDARKRYGAAAISLRGVGKGGESMRLAVEWVPGRIS